MLLKCSLALLHFMCYGLFAFSCKPFILGSFVTWQYAPLLGASLYAVFIFFFWVLLGGSDRWRNIFKMPRVYYASTMESLNYSLELFLFYPVDTWLWIRTFRALSRLANFPCIVLLCSFQTLVDKTCTCENFPE